MIDGFEPTKALVERWRQVSSYKTVFGSYLKNEDLQGKEPRVVISAVDVKVLEGDKGPEKKLVASFAGKDKALVLNLTNCETIAAIAGTDDYEQWPGLPIVLYTDHNIKFGGKTVSGIRVRAAAGAAPKPKYEVEEPPQVSAEDIPF